MKHTPRQPLPVNILSETLYPGSDWLDDDGLYTCEFCGHRYDGNAQCFCFGMCDEVPSPSPSSTSSPRPPPPPPPTKKRPLSKDRFEEEQAAISIQKFWRGFGALSEYKRHLQQSVRACRRMNESTFDGACPERFKWIIGHSYKVGDIIKYGSGNILLIARVTKVNKKSIRKETGELGWYGDFTSWNVKCGTTKDNLQTATRKIWKLKAVEEPPQQMTFSYDDSFEELLFCDDEENNYGRGYS